MLRVFSKFRSDDFDLSDKPRSERFQKLKSDDVQGLLDQDNSQSNVEFAKQYKSIIQKTIIY